MSGDENNVRWSWTKISLDQNLCDMSSPSTNTKIPTAERASGREREGFLEEIETLKKIAKANCPHIVSMVGCITIEEPLCLITEYLKYGDLLSYLRDIRKLVRVS